MWRVCKLILSVTVFLSVLVVVEDARRRPGVSFWNHAALFLSLVFSLMWFSYEASEFWKVWEDGPEGE